jgi:hypothetical protein
MITISFPILGKKLGFFLGNYVYNYSYKEKRERERIRKIKD